MKKTNYLTFAIIASVVLLTGFAAFYPSGAPAGYSGSPGDGSDCSSCHGTAATTAAGWITSDIPAAGYTAGQAYTITATNNMGGSGKYGYEISPQNVAGTLLGTLTAGTNSKLVGSGKYITHSTSSSTIKTWTFTWTAPLAGTGSVTFYGAFARGYSGPTTLSTLVVSENSASPPAAAGAITGSQSVCSGSSANYSVAAINGATSYVWSAPAGATITAGQGTIAVTVNFGANAVSGNVSVYGTNGSGNGTASNLAITIGTVPAQPATITGSTNSCQGTSQSYSVTNVAGVTYTWVVPAGWSITSGQGTNSITATVGTAGGNVQVTPANSCGNGSIQSSAVTVKLAPGIAASITGPANIDLIYSATTDYTSAAVSNADTYQWELSPAGAGSIAGTGIKGTVTWNSGFLGVANVRVKAINSCGEGGWSAVKSTTVSISTGIDKNAAPGMLVYPSPGNGTFTVTLNGLSPKVNLRILDVTGHEMYKSIIQGNKATTLDTKLAPGVYFVQAQEGSTTFVKKIVIR